jgi:hypothetical protein
MFRKFCQACGVALIAWGFWFAWTWVIAIAAGDVGVLLGVFAIFLDLSLTAGFGLMLIVFDPHQVIQNHWMSYHRLVEPRGNPKSFAEKIGVGDDDE